MSLPTTKTVPQQTLASLRALFYGVLGIGKSSLADEFEAAYFLATEDSQRDLSVYRDLIPDWATLNTKIGELAAGGHPFRTVIVDTLDAAWTLCARAVCEKYRVESLNDGPLSYGKGTAVAIAEFQRTMAKLSALPYGIIYLGHVQFETIEGDEKLKKAQVNIPEKARPVLATLPLIGYIDTVQVIGEDGKLTDRRVIRTKPSNRWDAKDHGGALPRGVWMGDTPREAYTNLKTALEAGWAKKQAEEDVEAGKGVTVATPASTPTLTAGQVKQIATAGLQIATSAPPAPIPPPVTVGTARPDAMTAEGIAKAEAAMTTASAATAEAKALEASEVEKLKIAAAVAAAEEMTKRAALDRRNAVAAVQAKAKALGMDIASFKAFTEGLTPPVKWHGVTIEGVKVVDAALDLYAAKVASEAQGSEDDKRMDEEQDENALDYDRDVKPD